MGFGHSKENDRVNEYDTKHAAYIPEDESDTLYNSIVKIILNDTHGTGFLMKINIKEKTINCLLTCNHVINEENINKKEIIEIYYGKINQEIQY